MNNMLNKIITTREEVEQELKQKGTEQADQDSTWERLKKFYPTGKDKEIPAEISCGDKNEQNVHTPQSLCNEIIEKIKETYERDNKDIRDIDIAVLFNLELVETLLYDFGVNKEKITYITDCIIKANFAKKHPRYKVINVLYIPEIDNIKVPDWRIIMKKFDCVIMNPPYKGQLHLDFFEKALDSVKDDGMVLAVHPATWLFTGNKGQKTQKIYLSLKKKISEYQKEFTLFNANKLFDIGLFMPCSITLVEKGKKNKTAKVIDKLQNKTFEYKSIWDVNKFGDYPEYYSLLKKISKVTKEDNLEDYKRSTEKGEIENHNFYVNIAEIRGHVSQKNDNIMVSDDFYTFIPRDLIAENKAYKKVYFGFDSEINANNFIAYLKTNFARFCLALVKSGSQLICGELVLVPYLDFSQEWTDEKLKQKFCITEKEWNFIESVIPKYYD